MLFRRHNHRWLVERLGTGGMVVGVVPDIGFQQVTLEMKSGDMLVGFTDGISEAMNAADEQFGEQRLIERVEACTGLGAAEMAKRVFCAVEDFAGNAPQHDDMTVLVMNAI